MLMEAGGVSGSIAPLISVVDLFQGSMVTRMAAIISKIKTMSPNRCFLVIDIGVKIEFLYFN